MTAQPHNASEVRPAATGTDLDGHKHSGEAMSETTIADPSEKRIDHVVSALAALERIHGTRALALALKEFQSDKDYRERHWAASPEFRARCAEYDEFFKEEGFDSFASLTRPVTVEPFPPVEETRLYQLAQEVANEPIPEDDDAPPSEAVLALRDEHARVAGTR